MKNIDQEVRELLINDEVLSSMVQGNIIHSGQLDIPELPYVTFSEIGNFPALHADNVVKASNVTYQINIYTMNTSPSDIGIEIDRVLTANRFKLYYTNQLFETDTGKTHRIQRYRKSVRE